MSHQIQLLPSEGTQRKWRHLPNGVLQAVPQFRPTHDAVLPQIPEKSDFNRRTGNQRVVHVEKGTDPVLGMGQGCRRRRGAGHGEQQSKNTSMMSE